MSAGSPLWMKETPGHSRCATDDESRLMGPAGGRLAITTIPWPVTGDTILIDGYRTNYLDFVKRLLHAGRKIKEKERVPWIVLNHEPPGGTPLSATYVAPEADFARRIIEAAEPDFSLHGHVHQAPTAPGGSWIWQLGGNGWRGEILRCEYLLLAGSLQRHHAFAGLRWRGKRSQSELIFS
jgi:hypothetical protein